MKTTKEMIEVMQAYESGEQIEFCYNDENIKVWENTDGEPLWNWVDTDYRVKPKKKYVPFDTPEEFFAAQRKHGGCLLISIEDGIRVAHDVSITLNGLVYEHGEDQWACTYLGDFEDLLLEDYKFEDGTPCGNEIEL